MSGSEPSSAQATAPDIVGFLSHLSSSTPVLAALETKIRLIIGISYIFNVHHSHGDELCARQQPSFDMILMLINLQALRMGPSYDPKKVYSDIARYLRKYRDDDGETEYRAVRYITPRLTESEGHDWDAIPSEEEALDDTEFPSYEALLAGCDGSKPPDPSSPDPHHHEWLHRVIDAFAIHIPDAINSYNQPLIREHRHDPHDIAARLDYLRILIQDSTRRLTTPVRPRTPRWHYNRRGEKDHEHLPPVYTDQRLIDHLRNYAYPELYQTYMTKPMPLEKSANKATIRMIPKKRNSEKFPDLTPELRKLYNTDRHGDSCLLRAISYATTLFRRPAYACFLAWDAVKFTHPSFESQDCVQLLVYLLSLILIQPELAESRLNNGSRIHNKQDLLFHIATYHFCSSHTAALFLGPAENRVYSTKYRNKVAYNPLVFWTEEDILHAHNHRTGPIKRRTPVPGSASHSLFIALWVLMHTDSLMEGWEMCTMLRTKDVRVCGRNTVAVYGALAAAWYGCFAPELVTAEEAAEKGRAVKVNASFVATDFEKDPMWTDDLCEMANRDQRMRYYMEWGVAVKKRWEIVPWGVSDGHGWNMRWYYEGRPMVPDT